MSDLIQQLFGDYCHYRRQTAYFQQMQRKRPYQRDLKTSAERDRVLGEMVEFCRARAIPPRQWLYYLFSRRKWLFPPGLDRASLLSQRAVPGYQGWGQFSGFQKRMRETAAIVEGERMERVFDPNRDLNRSVELLKESLVARGQAGWCRDRILSDTLGYHPRSHTCHRCPEQQLCAEQLCRSVPFDILALRRGEITSAQAKRTALLTGANRYAH